jgi:hypothetical protein
MKIVKMAKKMLLLLIETIGGKTMRFLQTFFMVLSVIFLLTGNGLAQTEKGDKEISGSASFTLVSEYGESSFNICVAGRMGFFITRHFELEPEVVISINNAGTPGYIFSGNLAYHLTPDKKAVPFILVGFGISNTLPVLHNVVVCGCEDETVKLFNAGVGVKVFVKKTIALRTEYRLNYFFDEGWHRTYHYGLFGISVFF